MNIAEILKKCPKYTNLYSPILGEVKLVGVDKKYITCRTSDGFEDSFQYDGKYMAKYHDAECMLFPSRDQRDWSKFGMTDKITDTQSEPQFKPFDKVLVRDNDHSKTIELNISNMIKKYRNKPVIIEAIQFEDNADCILAIHKFVGQETTRVNYEDKDNPYIKIETLEGTMKASVGDYIIKGVNGEFYPCKPDIFAKTYEEITE